MARNELLAKIFAESNDVSVDQWAIRRNSVVNQMISPPISAKLSNCVLSQMIQIEELELWRVSCSGHNCSPRCFGLEEWEEPILCADDMPHCTDDPIWPSWAFHTSVVLNFVLVLVLFVLSVLLVGRCNRPVPVKTVGHCDQCHRRLTDRKRISVFDEATIVSGL
ncbi:hypothetical protein niasHT_028899 [Heterodera trifolii]|uniref:Uncharacterized protein n=1 Tax=Heterodera trifolii TaxID=157864 RepID=A0ABD2KGB2_9BILA